MRNGFGATICKRFYLAALVCISVTAPLPAQKSFSNPHREKKAYEYVNTLVGSAPLDNPKLIGNAPPAGEELYTGMVLPGAMLPHGRAYLGPINRNRNLSYEAGRVHEYTYHHRTMFGFRSVMPGLTMMPLVGEWTVPPERRGSVYDKASEKGRAGYYSVALDDFKIKVEMTATPRTGMYRLTFPQSQESHVVLDLGLTGGTIEVPNDHTLRGCTDLNLDRWHQGTNTICYVAVFSKPFQSWGTFHASMDPPPNEDTILGVKSVTAGSTKDEGRFVGAYVNFATVAGEQLLIKMASANAVDTAEKSLQVENAAWDFDGLKTQAEKTWANKLNTIEVKGGSEHERMFFYSSLYHSLTSPRVFAREGEPFTGLDGRVKTVAYNRYGLVPFWDTGRDQLVLLTLLEPEVKRDILQSTLDQAKETGYMHTSFHGDHSVWMYLGDWLRGVPFDYASAYQYLRKNATDPKGPRRNLQEYLEKGWVSDIVPDQNPTPPYAEGNAGVAKTLEYSWDDYALALYARKLGKEDDYQMFLKRAHNYENVFDTSIGFMRGKTADGRWIAPFDPQEPYYNFMFKEASGWSTLWLVPHDVQGLINLLGGRDKFNAKLDQFLSTPNTAKGICRDCTGMIGQYVQGNQPDQQAPYYYDWSGQPWKTQALVRKILKLTYGSDKYGLAFPGNDDQGSTASWYVLSAMGFFPVDPSADVYALGSPIFNEVKIHLGNGKDFVIIAHNNSSKNVYIQSATLNGKPLKKPWFKHSDIANGATLELNMGPAPNENWGSDDSAAPPSMTH